MGGCLLARQQAGGMEDKRAGADRQIGLAAPGLLCDELDLYCAVDFLPGALTAWNQQIIERRAVGKRDVQVDGQPLRASDGLEGLAHDEAALRAVGKLAPHGEHFPRTDKVELLDLVENQDIEVHGLPFGHLTGIGLSRRR